MEYPISHYSCIRAERERERGGGGEGDRQTDRQTQIETETDGQREFRFSTTFLGKDGIDRSSVFI